MSGERVDVVERGHRWGRRTERARESGGATAEQADVCIFIVKPKGQILSYVTYKYSSY